VILAAADLKKLLKQVAGKDDLLIDTKIGQIVGQGPDLTTVVKSASLSGGGFLVAVCGKKLGQVVNRMAGDISVELVGAGLVLKSARATVTLETRAGKAFTPPPAKDAIVLPLSAIKPLLAYVSGMASKNIAEQYGGVVSLKSISGAIQAAATDGARLAMSEIPYDGPKFDYLIPVSAVSALANLEGETVEVESAPSYLRFHANCVDIYANKVSRQFPNYQAFLPKSYAVKYQVDAGMLRNALLTVRPVLDSQGEPAINVHFLDNQVKIISARGDAEDSADYTQLDPEPTFEPVSMSVPVNCDHLLSFFANISGDVTLSANSSKEPIWLESGSKKMLLAVLAG
jgi:DNA polymerase III sliding clamp (beta) subunit (PCNA family)